MSRLGKTPIQLPQGVEAKISNDGRVTVKGPKGQLDIELMKGILVKQEEKDLIVSLDENVKFQDSAFYGLYRSLLNNMVIGVSSGFEKVLTMVGVGYRAAVKGKLLDIQVGYSHPTEIEIPKGIEVIVNKGTEIVISGIDKRLVGHFAAQVRDIRKPEPYKGKGIRYRDEYVRRKAGKTAKK
mgnify:CR=1 FL=1